MIPHSCDSFSWETRLPQIIFHPAQLISDKQNLPMVPQQSEPGFHHAVLPFHLQKRCILRNGYFTLYPNGYIIILQAGTANRK